MCVCLKKAHLNKMRKSRIAALLALKFVFTKNLVRPIAHKGLEVADMVEKDIANLVHDESSLLSQMQRFDEPLTDGMDVEDIPKHLGDEVFSSVFGYAIAVSDPLNPGLERQSSACGCKKEKTLATTYISKVFDVPEKVPFGTDDLVDRFLPVALALVH